MSQPTDEEIAEALARQRRAHINHIIEGERAREQLRQQAALYMPGAFMQYIASLEDRIESLEREIEDCVQR